MIHTADPRASYLALKAEIDAAIRGVLEGPGYILGPAVEQFERSFADYVGVAHGVGVNSGTDALHLALRALGIGTGDEVITVSHTAVATVAAIEMSGASPVLVDIESRWHTIDSLAVERAIGPATRAVVAVHLYGQPASLGALRELCDARGFALIEDCAQAHGGRWQDTMVGAVGDAAAFSFYPTKNLGAVGDAGMVVTRDGGLAERVTRLRQYGWNAARHSEIEGCNSRLDAVQAAVLQVKLGHLEAHTARRRALAARYTEQLGDLPLRLPAERPGCRHVYHLYVVEAPDRAERDALLRHLTDRGIAPGIHYPAAVHTQPAYAKRLRTGPLTVTDALVPTILSLPLYPELRDEDQDRVIAAVRDFFRRAQ